MQGGRCRARPWIYGRRYRAPKSFTQNLVESATFINGTASYGFCKHLCYKLQ